MQNIYICEFKQLPFTLAGFDLTTVMLPIGKGYHYAMQSGQVDI
jgi:hypothetical protein